jgi:hypothetical protein
MPRKIIDYSNTSIYKLCCNDPSITDVYVGHTTNFTNRKRTHKSNCIYENRNAYNIYVYQFIREHGGWDNWSMIEIEKISCIDGNDACKNERRHIELLGATLNKRVPYRTQSEHIEYVKEYHKKYYAKEEIKIKTNEYQKKYNETIKKNYASNKNNIKDTKREYYQLNKDKLKEYGKKYYEQHKK